MLVQIDGSHHRWLRDEHPQFALHLAVDDATGKVVAARFRPDEDTCGYFELLCDLCSSYGLPLGLYSDRHSVFVPAIWSGPAKADRRRNPVRPRNAGTWDTPGICRLNIQESKEQPGPSRTAWSLKLRLAGVSTLAGANYLLARFLERFNRQFAVAPAQSRTAYRSLDPDLDVDQVHCFSPNPPKFGGEPVLN